MLRGRIMYSLKSQVNIIIKLLSKNIKRWRYKMEDKFSLAFYIEPGSLLFDLNDFRLDIQILEDYFYFGLFYRAFNIEFKSFSEPIDVNPRLMRSIINIFLIFCSFESIMYQDWFTQSIVINNRSLQVRMDTKNFNFEVGLQSYNPYKYISLFRIGKVARYNT